MSSAPTFTATSNGLGLFAYGLRPGVKLQGTTTAAIAGVSGQSSVFTGGGPAFDIERGFLLTTGTGVPQSTPSTLSVVTGRGGSALLEATLRNAGAPATTFDANVLTVTINVTNRKIKKVIMDVAFATEEFPSSASYGDVAAVTVNGRDVSLVGGSAAAPLAALPVNRDLFVDNRSTSLPTAYDAVTGHMTLSAPVNRGLNTITFAIADAGDRDYDSALAVGNIAFSGRRSGSSPPVSVDARDDSVLVRRGTAGSSSLLDDNGLGNDTGRAGPLTVTAVNGSEDLVGQWITLGSGTRVKVFADGDVRFSAKSLPANRGKGLLLEEISYTVSDGRTTDTAVATFGIYRSQPAAAVQLTFDALGSKWIGFPSVAKALAAVTSIASSVGGITLLLANGTGGGTHVLALDHLDLRAGPATTARFKFAAIVEDFTASGGNIGIVANAKANHIVTGNGNDTIRGLGGDDRIEGGGGTNFLYGGDGDDTIVGGSGRDVIDGGVGADVMSGGADRDTFYVDRLDVVHGGAGIDLASITQAGRYMVAGTEIEQWIGSAGGDEIDASGGDLFLHAYGRDGNDTLAGGSAADLLVGGNGNDVLSGNGGRDRLEGGAGDDVLDGGRGNDILFGGPGADRFRFTPGGAGDQIMDWSDGVDRIDFGEHDGVEAYADITVVRSGNNGVVYYSDDRTDYVVVYGAFANGARLTEADFLF